MFSFNDFHELDRGTELPANRWVEFNFYCNLNTPWCPGICVSPWIFAGNILDWMRKSSFSFRFMEGSLSPLHTKTSLKNQKHQRNLIGTVSVIAKTIPIRCSCSIRLVYNKSMCDLWAGNLFYSGNERAERTKHKPSLHHIRVVRMPCTKWMMLAVGRFLAHIIIHILFSLHIRVFEVDVPSFRTTLKQQPTRTHTSNTESTNNAGRYNVHVLLIFRSIYYCNS